MENTPQNSFWPEEPPPPKAKATQNFQPQPPFLESRLEDIKNETERRSQAKDEPTRDVDFASMQEILFSESELNEQNQRQFKEEPTRDVDFAAIQKTLESIAPSPPVEHQDNATEDIDFAELQRERAKVEKKGTPQLRIPPYFIDEKVLGEGAEALVYLAYADEAKQYLAGVAKVAKAGHEAQLYKEIGIAKLFINGQLKHDNIVGFIRTGVSALGLPYIVTEYLSPFPRKKIYLEDAFCTTTKIAQAIAYLHKNRVFHRDIKPQNIKFATYGPSIIPKLFDFGTITNQINDSQNAACSPYFAAPEVFLRIRGHSTDEIQFSRADVFSLGMTFLSFLGLNPYIVLEPNLEKKYEKDVRGLIDYLIHIHKNISSQFFQVIDTYFQEKQRWSPEVQEHLGISNTLREVFSQKLLPLLKQMLHFKPEERPKSATLVSQFEEMFLHIFGNTTDNYLAFGGALFPNSTRLALDENQVAGFYSPYYSPGQQLQFPSYPAWGTEAPDSTFFDPNYYPPYPPQQPYYNPEPETQVFQFPQTPYSNTTQPPETSSQQYQAPYSYPTESYPPQFPSYDAYSNTNYPPIENSPPKSKLQKSAFYDQSLYPQNTTPNNESLPEKKTSRLKPNAPSPFYNPPSSKMIQKDFYALPDEDTVRAKPSSNEYSQIVLPKASEKTYSFPKEESTRIKLPSANTSSYNPPTPSKTKYLNEPPTTQFPMPNLRGPEKMPTSTTLPPLPKKVNDLQSPPTTKPTSIFSQNQERVSPRMPTPRISSPQQTIQRLSSQLNPLPEKKKDPLNP